MTTTTTTTWKTLGQIVFGLGYPQSSIDLDVVLAVNSRFKAGGPSPNKTEAYQKELNMKRKHAVYCLVVWVGLCLVAGFVLFLPQPEKQPEKRNRTVIFWSVAGVVILLVLARLVIVYKYEGVAMSRYTTAHMKAGGCAPGDFKCIWKALL